MIGRESISWKCPSIQQVLRLLKIIEGCRYNLLRLEMIGRESISWKCQSIQQVLRLLKDY